MKHLVIVSPYFVPSNVASVHRTRLLARYLSEFDWKTTVVTAESSDYGQKLDHEIASLVPYEVKICREKAWPISRTKWMGIGCLSLRGIPGFYRAIEKIIRNEPIDFLYLPIPPNFAALLGPAVYRRWGIPYGVDYIDPWTFPWPGTNRWFSKPWLVYRLAHILEPIVLKHASLVTAVAESYFTDIFDKYPWLSNQVVKCAMPYGESEDGFNYLAQHPRDTTVFNSKDGKHHIVYAGAMLPNAYSVLDGLFQAVRKAADEKGSAFKLKFHFIGTGSSADDPEGYQVKPLIQKYNLGTYAEEHPRRMPYLDVLNHLKQAAGILILGSTDPHYTPSKLFQAMMSQRPILALLHSQSPSNAVFQKGPYGRLFNFEASLNSIKLAQLLKDFSADIMKPRNEICFPPEYHARESARQLADALEKAVKQ